MTKDEALDKALEALDNLLYWDNGKPEYDEAREAITAIKQARSAPVQEPVHQWQQKHSPYWYDGYPDNDDGGGPYETRTLYTTPPAAQRQWVGLTVDELITLEQKHRRHEDLSRAIEAKLKEKNGM
jgi:hypothetical protein